MEITRKLYRSGESTYSINQRRCRLKDIHLLMEDTGLGFASYALIAQGEIESFLSAKPLERRAIIEEAAGIIGYKSRRRNAELKLEMARQNLLRVNDIILEVERQLRSLKRQAAKARRCRQIKEEFGQVQRSRFALEAQQLQSQLAVLDKELESLRSARQEMAREITLHEKTYHESLKKRDRLDGLLAELRQRRSEIILELDRAENSIRYHEKQIEATQKQLKTNATETRIINRSLKTVLEDLGRFQSEEQALGEDEKRVETTLQEQSVLVERYAAEVQQLEAALEELRGRFMRLSAETVSLGNLKEQFEQRLKASLSGRERLEKEQSTYILKLEESRARRQEMERSVNLKQTQLETLRENLQKQEQQSKEQEAQLKELKQQLTEFQNHLIAYRERLQSLEEVELNHSQYSEGVQGFLKHLGRSQTIRTGGTLANSIQTSPEYERLVEEFLDEELGYVLVGFVGRSHAWHFGAKDSQKRQVHLFEPAFPQWI